MFSFCLSYPVLQALFVFSLQSWRQILILANVWTQPSLSTCLLCFPCRFEAYLVCPSVYLCLARLAQTHRHIHCPFILRICKQSLQSWRQIFVAVKCPDDFSNAALSTTLAQVSVQLLTNQSDDGRQTISRYTRRQPVWAECTLFINTSPIWPELATDFGPVIWWSGAAPRVQTAAVRRSFLNVVRPHHRRRSVLACQSQAEQVASRIHRRRHRHRPLPTRLLPLPLRPMTCPRRHSPTTFTNTADLPR